MIEEAFLQAVYAEPDDDAVRLVYADWLEENGNEDGHARAALIRLQCEFERATGERRDELDREAKALLKDNPAWSKAITKAGCGRRPIFRRGFPYQVTFGATQFVNSAKKLFERYPTVRSVRFYEASNEVTTLAKCKHLARLREADLSTLCRCGSCPIENDVRALIASGFVGNLTTLSLAGDRMDAAQARELAASAAFEQLRELDLSKNNIGNDGAEAIAASPWMGRLKRLNLRGNGIDAAMLKTLRKKFGKAVSG